MMLTTRQQLAHRAAPGVDKLWALQGNTNYVGPGATEDGGLLEDFLSRLPRSIAPVPQLARSISAFYDPPIFAYCIFDFPTIMAAAQKNHAHLLINDDVARLLVPPQRLVRHPRSFTAALGSARQKHLEVLLLELLSSHDSTPKALPVRIHRALVEPNPSLTRFFRALAIVTAAHMPIAAQGGHVMRALLDDGFVTEHLQLPGEYHDRCVALAQITMAAATEFGSLPLLNTSLALTRQSGAEIDYAIAKQITLCYVRTDKRALDWRLKGSGQKKLTAKNGWKLP